jgi:hypothetical protein
MKHARESRMQIIKYFNYVGTLLFVAGFLLLLIGLNWGGTQYPWKFAQIISTIAIGFLCIVGLAFWETYAPLKEPLLPVHLFKNIPWVASVFLLSIGASVSYAFNIVWSSMVGSVYAHPDPMWDGWIASTIGVDITTGELVGGLSAEKIGKVKYQCMFMMSLGSIFLACKFFPYS